MQLYKYLPTPSDRMGVLWALASIKDACIIEYGPAGTTHYGIEGFMKLNAELKSRLFTTHMDESDIVMGDSTRLRETILEVDRVYAPPVIFIVASSISSIIGTDIENVCAELNDEVQAQLICFSGGGFRGDFTVGIREVLTSLARHVVKPPSEKEGISYNIIGSTIDCYNFASDVKEIKGMMEACFGAVLHTVFTSDTSVQAIETAANASFNLVLRSEGQECAEILKEQYGMEYILGCPYGLSGTLQWLKAIEARIGIKGKEAFMCEQKDRGRKLLMRVRHGLVNYKRLSGVLSGHHDCVHGFYPFLVSELGLDIQRVFVNHSVQGCESIKSHIPLLCIAPDEAQKEAVLLALKPDLLIGDGVLLTMGKNAAIQIQTANPNLHEIQIYDGTPFMGFNGAAYFIERLLNGVHRAGSRLEARY